MCAFVMKLLCVIDDLWIESSQGHRRYESVQISVTVPYAKQICSFFLSRFDDCNSKPQA